MIFILIMNSAFAWGGPLPCYIISFNDDSKVNDMACDWPIKHELVPCGGTKLSTNPFL